ncbi:hypothetical protein GA0115240_10363 [Streptomyces sp. DvalAA-14]|uniref:hypothetical protein n=1 Tax=unclassified Streptomyces TaxID=2593676 RepID=UPI00081B9D7A|nr:MULTISPECIES: hypothetical protein [unclassified Streptomyces]MYS19043.1 hypothetical protein [Streptomyces sp. SID4948]SCD34989.1 hypothetical protein GA0115240_10363 [Streptomyces sp. DvalAA-14]
MRRIAPIATASALTCACVVAAGCGTTLTGARREGPAPSVTMKAPPGADPAIAADPAALAGMVRRDTSVSADVREDLTPCRDDSYPLDTDAGDLTAGDGPDLVVNITTCGEGIGIAAYVYRMVGGKYRCVFADERGPVYGTVDDGRLEVVHEVYPSDDPVAFPTGEDAVTYSWRAGHFVQTARFFTDFAAASPTPSPEPTSTEPVPMPKSALLDPELPSRAAFPARKGH